VATMSEAIESAQSVWSPMFGDYDVPREDTEHACSILGKIADGATFEAESAPIAWLALEVLGLNASTTPPTFREGANYRFVPEDICGLRLYRPLRIGSIAERLLKVKPYMIAAEMKGE
jgi:hypothetical protein